MYGEKIFKKMSLLSWKISLQEAIPEEY